MDESISLDWFSVAMDCILRVGYCTSPLNCDEYNTLGGLCGSNQELVGDFPLTNWETGDPGDALKKEKGVND